MGLRKSKMKRSDEALSRLIHYDQCYTRCKRRKIIYDESKVENSDPLATTGKRIFNPNNVRTTKVRDEVLTTAPTLVILDSEDEEVEELLQTSCLSEANKQDEVINISDEEEEEEEKLQNPSCLPKEIELQKQDEELYRQKSVVSSSVSVSKLLGTSGGKEELSKVETKEEKKGLFLGVAEEDVDGKNVEDEILEDLWIEMTVSMEVSKDDSNELTVQRSSKNDQDCDHSYILKDDIGYVCRVCGIIEKRIEHIIDYQYKKPSRHQTYYSGLRGKNEGQSQNGIIEKMDLSDHRVSHCEEMSPHPRHKKVMKPHQMEGFSFLTRNLMNSEKPDGCVLAHAPGSGKTFMIISFIQSFLAKFPNGRPLVILPKGILSTWKKEFQIWQVEDTSLLDFYSVKANNRIRQQEVLMSWKEKKSILFLGYKQFSTIVTDNSATNATKRCQELLLHLPSLLILDEGHTPRNENTDILHSLAKIETPRKVILSGTLYQNHVKEVFNILNLVRPKFMRLEASKVIKKRIMANVQFSGVRKQLKGNGDAAFYELVEHSLQQDKDSKRKELVIKDLRDLTSSFLHYYKGDFLDELPGLVDFTVVLKLTPRQKKEVDRLKKEETRHFKRNSQGSVLYVHPELKQFLEANSFQEKLSDDKLDQLLEKVDVKEGVKAKFFLTMLGLCEAANDKLLVFSQYLLPLKFLERLASYTKGWKLGKEMFMISGDSSSDEREWSMEMFNSSGDARVFFGSIKACGEGISLVGASRVIILDVHLNPSVSRQAIGRAFRPGQKKKVFTYRLVAADSPEEEDHATCYKKELIAKRWFEWNGVNGGGGEVEMKEVDVKGCGDMFLEECSALAGGIKALHRR